MDTSVDHGFRNLPGGNLPPQVAPLGMPMPKPTGSWFDQNLPPALSDPIQGTLSQGSGMGGAPTGSGYGQFVAPTGVNFMNDPGYQFQADEQQRAMRNSQFAQGQGLTGGALRDLTKYQGGLAAQAYQGVFNRQLAGDTFNRDTAFGQTDRALNAYLASRDTSWGDSDRLFGRNFSLATLGSNAAMGYGTNLGQYGQGGTDLMTGIGNSRAAGVIGRGNAAAGGIQNGASMAAYLAALRQNQPPKGGGFS